MDFQAPLQPLAISRSNYPFSSLSSSPHPSRSSGCCRKFGEARGRFIYNAQHGGARATCPPARRPGGADTGRSGTARGRRGSGPLGAHVSAPRPGGRSPGPGRRWRAGAPGGRLGRPLLTLSCRHYPGGTGSSGRARQRRGTLERRSGRRGSRGEGGRRGPQTRPGSATSPRAAPRSRTAAGPGLSLPTRADWDSGSERSPRGFPPPRKRSDAHRPLPPSPRPLLARRRRGSRRGEKWRAMAAPPRSTGLAGWGSLLCGERGAEVGVYQVVAAGEGMGGGPFEGYVLCERSDVNPA